MNNIHQQTATSKVETTEKDLIVERVFDAPRELVWQAFSNAEALKQWWGPKEWTLPVCNVDFRPGGTWHYCMQGPNGEESWGKAIYLEIDEPQKIVYKDSFSDAEGNSVEGMPEMTITLTLEDLGGKTKAISKTTFADAGALQAILDMGVIEGFTQTWDRLENYLAAM